MASVIAGPLALAFVLSLYSAIAPWRWVWRFWFCAGLLGFLALIVLMHWFPDDSSIGKGNIAVGGFYAIIGGLPILAVLAIRTLWRTIRWLAAWWTNARQGQGQP